MPISLILTPFDHFQIRLTFAVTPNLILEPCHNNSIPTGDVNRAFIGNVAMQVAPPAGLVGKLLMKSDAVITLVYYEAAY